MKKLISTVLIILAFTLTVKSQQASNAPFKSDSVTFEKEGNTLIYSGDASFKDQVFEITKAAKICFNPKTRKITAYGVKEFKITGTVTIPDPSKKSTALEYTIGETVAYMK